MLEILDGRGMGELPDFGDACDTVFYPDVEPLDKPSIMFSTGEPNLLSWTRKHPLHWTQVEVLDWLFYVGSQEKYQINFAQFQAEKFADKTGNQLALLGPDDFVNLMPQYGALLFSLFQSLLHQSNFDYDPAVDDFAATAEPEQLADYKMDADESCRYQSLIPYVPQPLPDYAIGSGYYAAGCASPPYQSSFWPPFESGVSSNLGSSMGSSSSSCDGLSPGRAPSSSSSNSLRADTADSEPSSDSDEEMTSGSGGSKSRSRPSPTKGNHLWEFVRDLLRNDEHNPTHIKWENQADGVFRFVHSETVAKMWGQKKNNPSMTYEKLSRAMRFCRKAGYFGAVPKSGQFPKKLVFKFGPLCWANGGFKD